MYKCITGLQYAFLVSHSMTFMPNPKVWESISKKDNVCHNIF